MKRILITGKNSYIGNEFEKWIGKWPTDYHVEKITVRDNLWIEQNWEDFDVLFHVSGIAHRKEHRGNSKLYFDVNSDLTFNIAYKAKKSGIKHFIFLSTMSVYGQEKGIINNMTPLEPKNAYGKSKLEAEHKIKTLEDDNFSIAIIRPPMVYGYNSPGNYRRLSKLSKITPIFPNLINKRSMIYIDHLSEFVRKIIDIEGSGIYLPQNKELVSTMNMVNKIAKINNKRIYFTKIFNPLLKIINIRFLNKVIGNLYYDTDLSSFELGYHIYSFEQTLEYTENGNDI